MATDWLHQTNFGYSTLASQLLIAGTTLVMATGEGARFPHAATADHFQMVIWGAAYPSPLADITREIVHAHYASADNYTLTRAQEGTSAKQWEIGDKCALVLSAQYLADIGTKIDGGLLAADVAFAATAKILGRATAGAGAGEEIDCTAAGRSILDDANVGAIRTTLGVGTGDSPTFAGATIGSLAGMIFGTAGALSALAATARFKWGTTTHNVATTGDQAITSVGFIPGAVILLANIYQSPAISVGFGAADGAGCVCSDEVDVAAQWDSFSWLGMLIPSVGTFATITLKSLDSDGFTITWAKTGLPTGTATLYYLCLR
jgi:hypothetical protein